MNKRISLCVLGIGKHYIKNIKPTILKSKKFEIKKEINTNTKKFKFKNINLKKILEDKIDAVYISTPSHTHHKFILAALECNKHIICEKPFVSNYTNFAKIVDLAKKKNLLIFECFMYRFHPVFYKLQRLISEKKFGNIKYAISYFNIPNIFPNHRYSQKLGQGFFFDTAVYPLSLCNHLFKIKPNKIKIKYNKVIKEKKNERRGCLFLNSKYLDLFLFWGENLKYKNSLEIVFTKGSIFIEKIFTKLKNENPQIVLNCGNRKSKLINLPIKNQFEEMLSYVAESLILKKNFGFERKNIINNIELLKKINP